MKKRLLSIILVLVMVLSLLPSVGAKEAGNIETSTEAFGGTLNTSTDLLFDFSNNDAAKTRYKSSA